MRDENCKIEKEIFQLKKLLKAGAPEDISLLQKEFQELRTNVRKELKVERIYNPIIGGTIIKSNQRHIIAADEKIKLAIEELEELKCEVIEGKKTLSHPLKYEK